MSFNKKLCRAIAKSGFRFEEVAIFAGMLANNLVYMIRYGSHPDEPLKQRLSDILDKPVDELFGENG